MNRLTAAIGIKAVGLCVALLLSLAALSAQVNVEVWMSADDQFYLYHGPASGSPLTPVGGYLGWGTANHYTFQVSANHYLYVVARDIAAGVWGLGGYVKIGSGPWVAITPGSGWEAVWIGNYPPPNDYYMPDQATVEGWIASANSGNAWLPAVAGTAVPGSGLPNNYGGMPAQTPIWQDRPASWRDRQGPYDMILFRYLVPEPTSMAVLGAGLAGLLCRRRRRA